VVGAGDRGQRRRQAKGEAVAGGPGPHAGRRRPTRHSGEAERGHWGFSKKRWAASQAGFDVVAPAPASTWKSAGNPKCPKRPHPPFKAKGIVSGLRVFDITNPNAPQEIAYFNGKIVPDSNPEHQGAWAMAAPAFSPRAHEIWYSDGNLGFYAVGLTPSAVRVDQPIVPEVPVAGLLPLAALLVLASAVASRRRRQL
jgi:hypothetical protein